MDLVRQSLRFAERVPEDFPGSLDEGSSRRGMIPVIILICGVFR